jgi:hypothetical protein
MDHIRLPNWLYCMVYAATIKVGDSSQLEELVDTGVRLVKAQDRSAS